MDMTMPEMDGIEAAQKIIGEFSDTKIVMVTWKQFKKTCKRKIELQFC
jgi:DNA-binding NarL/FixJ family response regulator